MVEKKDIYLVCQPFQNEAGTTEHEPTRVGLRLEKPPSTYAESALGSMNSRRLIKANASWSTEHSIRQSSTLWVYCKKRYQAIATSCYKCPSFQGNSKGHVFGVGIIMYTMAFLWRSFSFSPNLVAMVTIAFNVECPRQNVLKWLPSQSSLCV